MITRTGAIFAFFACILLLISLRSNGQIKAEYGYLNATHWNFEQERLPLSGQWTFYKDKLLPPNECGLNEGVISNFPELWSNVQHDGIGFGTYQLKIIVADSVHTLSLEIPQMYNSYNLWINGELVASTGKVGTNHKDAIPQWVYKTASFNVTNDTLCLVLQLANFHHYKGGSKDAILLGAPAKINQHKLLAFGSNMAELILLFIAGSVFLALYLRKRNRKVILYFSLLCLTWCVRAGFSNLYPIAMLFPGFNWNLLVRIEYLTLYSASIWAILFLNTLFENIKKQIFTYMLVGINVFFVLFTLFTLPYTFSHWVSVYLTVSGITIVYGAVIVIRAILFEQKGAWLLVVSLLLGVIVFGYDIIAYGSSSYNLVFLHVGYIVIFVMITMALLIHMGILKGKLSRHDVLTYHDMVNGHNKN